MKSRILFRADSGVAMGSGHMVRCTALAQAFAGRGCDVAFVCRNRAGALLRLPARYGFLVHELPEELSLDADAEATQDFASRWGADVAVVDHYRLEARWESRVLRSVTNLLAIDDLADRDHLCRWLLDQNDVRSEDGRYVGRVPADCTLLLGPQFALLRPEFLAARRQSKPRDGQLRRLVVFFSGSDDGNETAKGLTGLAMLDPASLSIDVVIGSTHPDPAGIAAACQRHDWHFHRQIDYMARLLAQADLSLGSAGTTSWERCVLGVPALVVELEDNQREVVAALAKYGCVKMLGVAGHVTPQDYADALRSVRSDELAAMSRAAWELVDGQGAERVAHEVLAVMSL